MLALRYFGEPSDLAMLLQAGFRIEALVGCTLREFLCIEMEICGDYANRRIQTVFIDGKAVDDFDTAQIDSGTSLALSGAMPGLVGAVMRRGGALGSLRDSITYHLEEMRPAEVQGEVEIRLFNFIAEELAHIFLRRGVVVEAEKVLRFLKLDMVPLEHLKHETGPDRFENLTRESLTALLRPGEEVRIRSVESVARSA